MSFSLVHHLLHTLKPRPLRSRGGGLLRVKTSPPPARRKTGKWPQRLRNWIAVVGIGGRSASAALHDGKPAARNESALGDACSAFHAALEDIATTPQAALCADHIRAARSLHELWHLRTQVFSLVSRHHSQAEANRRLGLLDRHFASRVRRTGFNTAAAKDGHESVPPL